MSKKRIMAYFLHEEEMGFALDQMPAGIATRATCWEKLTTIRFLLSKIEA